MTTSKQRIHIIHCDFKPEDHFRNEFIACIIGYLSKSSETGEGGEKTSGVVDDKGINIGTHG